MSNLLFLNNIIPQTINFNGAAVSSVYYNNVLVWSAKAQILENPSAVIFASSEPFTMDVSNTIAWDGIMEYSINGGQTWSVWSGETITAALLDDNYQLMFRGTGNTIVTKNGRNVLPWNITGSKVECVGNMENLLDYQTVAAGEHPTMVNSCYYKIFNGCEALTDASRLHLPATTLTQYCYGYMFDGCSNLAKAPELPATTLVQSCYDHMFSNCSSLTIAPELPATTVAILCYYCMFSNCDSLINIPDLPATTLLSMCYEGMFSGCDSIKISETKTEECPYEYRIPSSGTITSYKNSSLEDMFGDDIVIEPNKTYYININATADEPDIPDVPDDDVRLKQPVTFTSSQVFTINTEDYNKGWDGNIEYSSDGINWVVWNGEAITASLIDGEYKLLFRGLNNTYVSSHGHSWDIDGYGVKVSGNIENLLDYQTVAAGGHPTMGDYCFSHMFYYTFYLEDASELLLPATTLTPYCYESMFECCFDLEKAPELPATTLAPYCYSSMFRDTEITEAPELPATTLADYCYYYMFYGCEYLKNAPELPATILAPYCYSYMFIHCYKLENIPELPATIIPKGCYDWMFYNCKKIKVSETKTEECPYEYRIPTNGEATSYYTASTMFGGPGAPVHIQPNRTYYTNIYNASDTPVVIDKNAMLKFVSSTPFSIRPSYYTVDGDTHACWDGTLQYSINGGDTWSTFTKYFDTPNEDYYQDAGLVNGEYMLCIRGKDNTRISCIYSGSTAVLVPWELIGYEIHCNGNINTLLNYEKVSDEVWNDNPQMAINAFRHMFSGNDTLITAPNLPARTVSDNCYDSMFEDCVNLIEAPVILAKNLAPYCCWGMFKGCTGLTKAPTLQATTLAFACYSAMFEGCSSLTEVPRLPATALAPYCYSSMFESCSSLVELPKLLATDLPTSCYTEMFRYCSSIKISESQTSECSNVYRIPYSGTVANYATDSLENMFGSGIKIKHNTTYYTNAAIVS